MPIVLVDADDEEIIALHLAVGDDDFQFTLPYNVEYAEIYAIDLEENGSIWQWVTYPPQTDEDDADTDARQDTRAEFFLNWLEDNGERMEEASVAEADANAKVAANSNDLTQLAAAFVDQQNFSKYGNNYQIAHYVYGCHSVETGDDWFYVQQQCVFSGNKAYGALSHRWRRMGIQHLHSLPAHRELSVDTYQLTV
jgi:hypothetical protein